MRHSIFWSIVEEPTLKKRNMQTFKIKQGANFIEQRNFFGKLMLFVGLSKNLD
jgi:hypothetical protein